MPFMYRNGCRCSVVRPSRLEMFEKVGLTAMVKMARPASKPEKMEPRKPTLASLILLPSKAEYIWSDEEESAAIV